MAAHISQRELRNDSAAVLRRVEAGEAVTVTRRGVPVADLVPHRGGVRAASVRNVPARRLVESISTLPPWESGRFARELAELDDVVDDGEHDPWP